MNAILTLKRLKGAKACNEQVILFSTCFGKQVEVTEDLALAHASDFDWDWAARNLLDAPARAEYDKVRATAQAEYYKACATAWAEYDKACAPARAEYDKVRATARAEYAKACAPAWARGYIITHERRHNDHPRTLPAALRT